MKGEVRVGGLTGKGVVTGVWGAEWRGFTAGSSFAANAVLLPQSCGAHSRSRRQGLQPSFFPNSLRPQKPPPTPSTQPPHCPVPSRSPRLTRRLCPHEDQTPPPNTHTALNPIPCTGWVGGVGGASSTSPHAVPYVEVVIRPPQRHKLPSNPPPIFSARVNRTSRWGDWLGLMRHAVNPKP